MTPKPFSLRVLDVEISLLSIDPHTHTSIVVPWDVWPVVVTYAGPAGRDYCILTHHPLRESVVPSDVVREDDGRCVVCNALAERFGCFAPLDAGCRGLVMTVRGFASISHLSAQRKVEFRAEFAERQYGQIWSSRETIARTIEANRAVEKTSSGAKPVPTTARRGRRAMPTPRPAKSFRLTWRNLRAKNQGSDRRLPADSPRGRISNATRQARIALHGTTLAPKTDGC